MTPRRERAKVFLQGLVQFLALVLVAGGVGVALGLGLSKLAQDEQPDATGATVAQATATAVPAAVPPPTPPTATAPTATTATTATTPTTPRSPLAQIRVSVLDARLFTDSTPSGRQEQRARVTVRVRAENPGTEGVTLDSPTLRVGSVRVPVDAAGAQLDPLGAGASQTVTLRFALDGEATPKLVRDRRARILIAEQSLAMRLKVRAPTG